MEILVSNTNIVEVESEVIALGIFNGEQSLGGAVGAVDNALVGEISALLEERDFLGEQGELYVLRTEGAIPAKRVMLVGLGHQDRFDLDVVRSVSAIVAQNARRYAHLTSVVHDAAAGRFEANETAQAVIEGSLLGMYEFNEYKPGSEAPRLTSLVLVEMDESKISLVEQGIRRGQAIADAVAFARDLGNEPGNGLPPIEMASRAVEMAQRVGLECEILDEEGIRQQHMAGVIGVSLGTAQPPRFISLKHNVTQNSRPIVLIGKGVTFDSGGISIKGRAGMESMKFDMGGAAAVLGAMQSIASLDLPIPVIGLVPAVENLPSGTALKPGDILTYKNGVSVEVTNTDAEGRLILADGLIYAEQFNPQYVIDLATLTGACVVALGKEAAGLFCEDSDLKSKIENAGARTSERVWPLPLFDEYKDLLKSKYATIGNSVILKGGMPQAGSSAAGVFLKQFVNYPWAHIDIAGTAWDIEKPYAREGASGFGVRLLVELLSGESAELRPD